MHDIYKYIQMYMDVEEEENVIECINYLSMKICIFWISMKHKHVFNYTILNVKVMYWLALSIIFLFNHVYYL